MTSKQKRKGTDFENLAVEILNRLIRKSRWKRVPSSGAMGTILGEPLLLSDISGKVDSIPRQFKVEAKVGYGGASQFTLKKEWLDKIAAEAKSMYGIPFLIGKFSGARDGVKVFIVLDVETFAEIINLITDKYEGTNDSR